MKRSRKLTPLQFLNSLIFSTIRHGDPSLADLACDLQVEYGLDISREALHKKFSAEAEAFLQEMVRHVLQLPTFNQHSYPLQKVFSSLQIRDSTKFKLPNCFWSDYPGNKSYSPNEPAQIAIQLQLDLFSGQWKEALITPIRRNDQKDSAESISNLTKGELALRDLGYITFPYLKGVQKQEAFCLSKLPASAKVLDCNQQPLNWHHVYQQAMNTADKYLEMDVLIGVRDKIPMRMIIRPLCDEQIAQRQRKAEFRLKHAQDYNRLSEDYMTKMKLAIIITNANQSQIPKDSAHEIYRLRWQVELMFKTWKSHMQLEKNSRMKVERLRCQIWAKLLWGLIHNYIQQAGDSGLTVLNKDMKISVLKFYKRAKNYAGLLRAFLKGILQPGEWVDKAVIPLISHSLLEQKNGRVSHLQTLMAPLE